MTKAEYRAIFESQFGDSSKGPERDTISKALKDRPKRSEETFEALVGIETREVSPWIKVPVAKYADKVLEP